MATVPKVDVGSDYKEKYGFSVPEDFVFKAKRGLNPEIVKEISWMKKEPEWMLKFRLRSLEIFRKKPMPTWGADLSVIDFENIFYYLRASDKQSTSWEDLPPDIKATYDRLGVPEAERKFLAGVSAQYESEVVYHSLHEELSKKGVIFTDTDSALRDHPELFKEYFGTIIPPADNKFAALNSAVWSGGSFIYVPKGVRVEIPLQAYFRINAENMGQFERTLIICDEGSFVHYIEGCTAPIYTTDSLHSAVVEIIVKRNARCRYTTIPELVDQRLQPCHQALPRLRRRDDGVGGRKPGLPCSRYPSFHEQRRQAHRGRRSWRLRLQPHARVPLGSSGCNRDKGLILLVRPGG